MVDGTLVNTETWEAKLSAAGTEATSDADKADRKAAAWAGLLRENKLGYFALLRNLRNILAQAPELVPLACEQLQDEQRLRRSKVLPFRLLTAYISEKMFEVMAMVETDPQALINRVRAVEL